MQTSTYGSQATSQEQPLMDTNMRLASDTAQAATETYNKASNWLQQNYGKTLGVVGALAAAGVIGYFIGRSNMNSKTEMQM